jgi:hypothetical protein
VAENDAQTFVPGPLDELAPGLRRRSERLPALIAHPRVCRAPTSEGHHVVALASFKAAQSARNFHLAFRPIVEAVLLHELTQSRSELAERTSLQSIQVYVFAALPFDPAAALGLLGLFPTTLDDGSAREALALLRREAQLVEDAPGQEPLLRFQALLAPPTPVVAELEKHLRMDTSLGVWGSQPGQLARRLADSLDSLGHSGVEPSRAGIERLEQVLVQHTPNTLRLIPPLCFQALCDLIAVAAHSTYDCEVQWAVCERDADTGLSPPPLIKVSGRHGDGHVPLAEHLLRWCVMPRRADEQIPSLGAWAEHEFGP